MKPLFQCLEAKWIHFGQKWGYENGLDFGLDESMRNGLYDNCEYLCGSGNCDHFDAEDFVDHDGCDRTGFHDSF